MPNHRVTDTWGRWASCFLSALRIMAAFTFIPHGAMKLFAYPASVLPNGGTVPLGSLFGVAGMLEVVGGTFLLLGLFTRPVAFLLSGEMAVAYFTVHVHQGFWPIQNGGEVVVLYCFLWLFFSAAGPGQWSLDALRRKTETQPN